MLEHFYRKPLVDCSWRLLSWKCILQGWRSSGRGVHCKKGIPQAFTKLVGKQLCWSLFLNKVLEGLRPLPSLKKRLQHSFCYWQLVLLLTLLNYLWLVKIQIIIIQSKWKLKIKSNDFMSKKHWKVISLPARPHILSTT